MLYVITKKAVYTPCVKCGAPIGYTRNSIDPIKIYNIGKTCCGSVHWLPIWILDNFTRLDSLLDKQLAKGKKELILINPSEALKEC